MTCKAEALPCPNLPALFGFRYRITWDPAYCTHRVPRSKLDPWYAQIPCRYGTIYPVGTDRLAVEVDYHPGLAVKLARVPGVVCTQNGSEEKTFQFPLSAFDAVAELVLPRRRRKLTEERKAKLREMSSKFGFAAR